MVVAECQLRRQCPPRCETGGMGTDGSAESVARICTGSLSSFLVTYASKRIEVGSVYGSAFVRSECDTHE